VLICTEKDAVKLWKKHPDALAVPLELALDARFLQGLKDQLLRLQRRYHRPPRLRAERMAPCLILNCPPWTPSCSNCWYAQSPKAH
jgi:hypothetical protein